MSDPGNGDSSLVHAPVAVALAWLVPGLGHIYLGHRVRGTILLVAVTVTFWSGVAIGGVKSVTPVKPSQSASAGGEQPKLERSWWFFGQILNGGYALAAYGAGRLVPDVGPAGNPRYLSWPSGDVASVYTGVAGLLNLLIILDALARAEGLGALRQKSTGPPPGGGRRRGGRHGV